MRRKVDTYVSECNTDTSKETRPAIKFHDFKKEIRCFGSYQNDRICDFCSIVKSYAHDRCKQMTRNE